MNSQLLLLLYTWQLYHTQSSVTAEGGLGEDRDSWRVLQTTLQSLMGAFILNAMNSIGVSMSRPALASNLYFETLLNLSWGQVGTGKSEAGRPVKSGPGSSVAGQWLDEVGSSE